MEAAHRAEAEESCITCKINQTRHESVKCIWHVRVQTLLQGKANLALTAGKPQRAK